jgi:hypothetical protein
MDDVLGIDKNCNLSFAVMRVGEGINKIIDQETGKFADAEVQTRFENWLARGGWDKYADEEERSLV